MPGSHGGFGRVEFTLNGREVSIEAPGGATLLELLREGCGLTSMKDGCAPEGSCGACTVVVDGKAVVSCAQPAARVVGRHVTTLEGLSGEQRRLWADAFVVASDGKRRQRPRQGGGRVADREANPASPDIDSKHAHHAIIPRRQPDGAAAIPRRADM